MCWTIYPALNSFKFCKKVCFICCCIVRNINNTFFTIFLTSQSTSNLGSVSIKWARGEYWNVVSTWHLLSFLVKSWWKQKLLFNLLVRLFFPLFSIFASFFRALLQWSLFYPNIITKVILHTKYQIFTQA